MHCTLHIVTTKSQKQYHAEHYLRCVFFWTTKLMQRGTKSSCIESNNKDWFAASWNFKLMPNIKVLKHVKWSTENFFYATTQINAINTLSGVKVELITFHNESANGLTVVKCACDIICTHETPSRVQIMTPMRTDEVLTKTFPSTLSVINMSHVWKTERFLPMLKTHPKHVGMTLHFVIKSKSSLVKKCGCTHIYLENCNTYHLFMPDNAA